MTQQNFCFRTHIMVQLSLCGTDRCLTISFCASCRNLFYLNIFTAMGARRNFFGGGAGQNHHHFNKLTRFWRQRKFARFFLRFFVTDIGHLWRAPKVRAKILGYFVVWQHLMSFFSNSRGRQGKCPPPQFPAGTHAPMFTAKMPVRFVSQNIDIKF